jgi:hypothetical protein
VYGGLNDRVHDLLLCGVDSSMVDLSMSISHLQSEEGDLHIYREIEALIRAASRPWTPSHHAYLYGSEFKACIASLCLVKVEIMRIIALTLRLNLDESENAVIIIDRVKFILLRTRLNSVLNFRLILSSFSPDPFMSR